MQQMLRYTFLDGGIRIANNIASSNFVMWAFVIRQQRKIHFHPFLVAFLGFLQTFSHSRVSLALLYPTLTSQGSTF